MTVAFLAVAREGLEAALFLIAAATTEEGWAVLVGGLVSLAAASVLGALVVLGGRRLPMRQFFTVTGLILIVFAAGLVSRTVLWLQAAGELGTAWNNVYDLTAYRWLTVGTESGRFLGAMFGWDPAPRSSRSPPTCCSWSPSPGCSSAPPGAPAARRSSPPTGPPRSP